MKKIFWLLIGFQCTSIFSYNQFHVLHIQEQLKENQHLNASHCDLRGLGDLLKHSDLEHAQLAGALFSKISENPEPIFSGLIEVPNQISDLSGTNFSDACCVSTNFAGATLQNANFDNADIAYADFSDTDLTGASFQGAKNIELATFCHAIMPDGSKNDHTFWQSSDGQKFFSHCTN